MPSRFWASPSGNHCAEVDMVAPAWSRCDSCGLLIHGRRLGRNLGVCPECGHHRRLTATDRISQLVDTGTFSPLDMTVKSTDLLGFTDRRPYSERLDEARAATDLDEAVVCGTAQIRGYPLVLAVMDFRF